MLRAPVARIRPGQDALGRRGRWLPGGIVGRTDDMVVIRGMNVYPSAIEEAVRSISGAGEFRITFYSERRGMEAI